MRSGTVILSLVAAATALPNGAENIRLQKRHYAGLSKRQAVATPAGESTSGASRDRVGSVPYGTTITGCTQNGVIALTYDDGPGSYTGGLLDLLQQNDVKATFFVTGLNTIPGGMDSCSSIGPGLLNRMDAAGHQIAHHTWTHPDMDTLSESDFNNQLYWNEMALRNAIGKFPTYFRAPFLSCGATCLQRLANLGYHHISTNLDTNDWRYQTPENHQNAKNEFKTKLDARPSGPIVLAHDIHYQTVFNLTQYMIDEAKAAGYRFVTVGECLGDPVENWYREVGGEVVCENSPQPPADPQPPTNAGKCGADANGQSCNGAPEGPCCSRYNYCGTTPEHCGVGCQPLFGTCTDGTSPAPQPSTSADCPQPKPDPQPNPQPDGQCAVNGVSCNGSPSGPCCSRYNFCGSTPEHCGTGCQSAFGTCN